MCIHAYFNLVFQHSSCQILKFFLSISLNMMGECFVQKLNVMFDFQENEKVLEETRYSLSKLYCMGETYAELNICNTIKKDYRMSYLTKDIFSCILRCKGNNQYFRRKKIKQNMTHDLQISLKEYNFHFKGV
jgi:hypothetical protein